MIDRRFVSNIEWPLLIVIFLLCLSGLIVLYSAGYDPDSGKSVPMKRQAIAMGLGFVFYFVAMFLQTNFWRRIGLVLYVLGCVLLSLIIFKGVVAGGARRWLVLGGLRFQPSEFMKVGIILVMARVFSRENSPRDGHTLLRLFLPCLVLLVPTALIVQQPDLGTALCHVLIGGSMLLVAGIRGRTFAWLMVAGWMLVIPSWYLLEDYQRDRIKTFINPDADPAGRGYHAIQSKVAVGSGALTGKGFRKGTQTQLRFLPEQTTDFIFSVVAEEWGFVGSVSVIALYAMLILRLLKISSRCTDEFSAFAAVGVAALVFWHVMINIGMVIGVMPVVGLTLPLLSYGGSSVVTFMTALGMVAGFSKRRFVFA